MNQEILFKESQKFTQWWLWLLLLIANASTLYTTFVFSSQHQVIYATIGVLFITFLIFIIRLTTIVKSDGIYIQFLPFVPKYKHFAWDTISKSYVKTYSPIKDFGGWGVRWGKGGKAYNIAGNEGLQLEFTNGKKLLIGTQQPEALKKALQQLNHWKE